MELDDEVPEDLLAENTRLFVNAKPLPEKKVILNRMVTPAFSFLIDEDQVIQDLRDLGISEKAIKEIQAHGVDEAGLKRLCQRVDDQEEDPLTMEDLRESEDEDEEGDDTSGLDESSSKLGFLVTNLSTL